MTDDDTMGTRTIAPNTPDHDLTISHCCKAIAAGSIDLAVDALNMARAKLESAGANDPLQIERYVHLAEKLTGISKSMYELGEHSHRIATGTQR